MVDGCDPAAVPWFMYVRSFDEPYCAPKGVPGPSHVEAPVGNVTLLAVDVQVAAGEANPSAAPPKEKVPLGPDDVHVP